MKKLITVIVGMVLVSACSDTKKEPIIETTQNQELIVQKENKPEKIFDTRISLGLNPMQKNHQLKNMRSHLEAIQSLIMLLANDEYEEASTVAYEKLGSTTEMKLMCASFGNEQFETMGLEFHKSADEMSEIFKKEDKTESLTALSNTMNYCVNCHSTFKQ